MVAAIVITPFLNLHIAIKSIVLGLFICIFFIGIFSLYEKYKEKNINEIKELKYFGDNSIYANYNYGVGLEPHSIESIESDIPDYDPVYDLFDSNTNYLNKDINGLNTIFNTLGKKNLIDKYI